MARPSVADERREQIIDATLRTMAEFGVSATTLDRIATTAGMSRGHVRHFVGNREQLLVDAAREFYAPHGGSPLILPPDIDSLEATLDYLFGEEFTASTSDNAIVLGFVDLSRTIAAIAEVLTEAYLDAQTRVDAMLAESYPSADPEARAEAAVAMLSAALGNVFLEEFNHDPNRPARTRRAIEELLRTL